MKRTWINMESKHQGGDIYEVECPSCSMKRDIYARDKEFAAIVFKKHGKHIRTKTFDCSNCETKFRVIGGQAQWRM